MPSAMFQLLARLQCCSKYLVDWFYSYTYIYQISAVFSPANLGF